MCTEDDKSIQREARGNIRKGDWETTIPKDIISN